MSQGDSSDEEQEDGNGETVSSITDGTLGITGLTVTAGTNCQKAAAVSSITDGSSGIAGLSVTDGSSRKRTADKPILSDLPNKLKEG